MRKLHTTLEAGDVVLIPAGAGASIEFIEKSGRRSRVAIACDSPVTITKAHGQTVGPASGHPIARRPVPTRTG